jgi:predicted nucleic acid-binding protein
MGHEILRVRTGMQVRAIPRRRDLAPQFVGQRIAATAAVHELALLHRDPHFRMIPPGLLQQIDLD